MGKLLFWVAVIALIWLAVSLVRVSERKQARAQDERRESEAARKGSGRRPKGGAERLEQMVACTHCGVFLPASDALQGRNGRYCCVEHRDARRP